MTTDKNNFRYNRTEDVVFTSCSHCLLIDTQAIRSKILDLAMRGKLTEQLPEDGSAEELYLQIQKGKQALVKAGKTKKEKPLPETAADEVPFEVPANWKLCRFGAVITLVSGTDYPPEEYNDEGKGMPYITGASNLLSEGILINRWTEKARCIANLGDVLLVCKGSGYGKVAMCDIDEAHIARQIMAVKRTPLLEMRFILYFLMAKFNYLKEKGQGLIPGVDRKSVLNMAFLLPSFAEQKRIVERIDQTFSILDTIDALQTQYTDNLAVLKSKLIDAAIQGKLTEQLAEDGTAEDLYRQIQAEKQTLIKAGKLKKRKPLPPVEDGIIPFEVPEGWKWTRLGDLMLDVSTGPFGSMLHKSDYCDGGVPLINPLHIQNGAIHPSDNMRVSESTLKRLSQYRLSEGMIVVARRGELGRCASIGKKEDGWLCGTGSFFLKPSRFVFVPFITLVISSPFARSVFRGAAIGMTMANLNHNLLKELPFPLPPLAEQKRIVAKLSKLLPLCEMDK